MLCVRFVASFAFIFHLVGAGVTFRADLRAH
jgi:hypothetical protein